MRLSHSDVRDVFFSGTHSFAYDEDLVNKIHFLLSQGYLTSEKLVIASKEDYLRLCSDATSLAKHDEASGGGSSHVALKLLGKEYLAKFGMSTLFEQPFCGHYPDVISSDLLTIIECGHTNNADKIFTYFTQGKITELIQIPYPTIEDTCVYGYRFTANKDLTGFLKVEFDIEKENILKIMNRDKKK